MQTRKLGNSDLHITPVGIGAWAMGGSGWAFSWSHQEDRDSIDAIHAALDAGINWIDTAAVYGLGHTEVGDLADVDRIGQQSMLDDQLLGRPIDVVTQTLNKVP